MGYWGPAPRGGDWWGAGPGAHSHVGGVRWWNVLHPARWSALLADGASPAAGRETPCGEAAHLEHVMLGLRLADGLPLRDVDGAAARRAAGDGLLDDDALRAGRVVLTRRGRLLADRVTLDLAA
jgi:oxygen-independent coproporphyrinogen-3 oxidase